MAERARPPRLFLPGPTEARPEVLEAQNRRLIGHRSDEIHDLLDSIQPRLRRLFQTDHRVYVSTSSATGLFEAAVRNGVAERALCCVNGAFSHRWADVVAANGKAHDRLEVEWGAPITPELVVEALERRDDYDAVTVVHNETSTAVTSPVGEIADAVRERAPDALILVDTVSSLGGIDVPVGGWGLDVCLTGGQKCLALPPGLAFAAVSDRALERAREIPDRGWYFDWLVFERYLERSETPTTPAITLLYALDRQLDRILEEEGLEARFARHEAMARHVQGWALERFGILAREGYRSNSVTAVENTRGIDVGAMNAFLTERDMVVSNGYGKIADVTFRIGHMGDHTVEEMETLTATIDDFLERA
ncbi:MAG: alanine--glyoxylate aminotransferase family protein [Gemmatimonadota bacterium]|nr:alanine--glyoxylate aminotransferase family protein [Gemmatimonadota bacterium]